MRHTRLVPVGVALLIGLAEPALAQDGRDPSWQVEGTVGAISDYRFRGLSLSDGKAAAQAGATTAHESGVYADAYLSTIAEYGVGADGDGAKLEATFALGWTGQVARLNVDAAVAAYRYPDGSGVSYVEIPVQVGQTRGPVTWTLGAAWAPRGQSALGDRSNRYVWGGLDLTPDRLPVSLHGVLGYETGAYAPGGKTDWRLGASTPFGPLTLALDYIDSDADAAAAVASLFVSF